MKRWHEKARNFPSLQFGKSPAGETHFQSTSVMLHARESKSK
jgi:hypothetical protein